MANRWSIAAAGFLKLFLWACLTKRGPEDDTDLRTSTMADEGSY